MAQTLEWLSKVEEVLFSLEQTPQFDLPGAFPWKKMEEALAKSFNRPSLKLRSTGLGWQKSEEALLGFSSESFALKGFLTPLSSPFYFVMQERDVKLMMADLLGGKEEEAFAIEKETLLGFFHFMALKLFLEIERLHWISPLTFQLETAPFSIEEEVKEKDVFAIDLFGEWDLRALGGRLLIPVEFRAALKRHFALFERPKLPLEEAHFPVDLALEVASTTLPWSEWRTVKEGDFILLDSVSYDAEEKSGRVIVTLAGTPIFRGKLEDEGLWLLDYPNFEKVMSMEEEREEVEFVEEFAGESEPKEPTLRTISAEEIPVTVTVEIGRLSMKASDLMRLSAGDLLDLKVGAENGVDLVVKGKKVGRGELVKMEEMLFVRVLKL